MFSSARDNLALNMMDATFTREDIIRKGALRLMHQTLGYKLTAQQHLNLNLSLFPDHFE